MKIGVLGGTFNPIHNAHLQMAELAIDALALDRVLIMVAADPPHKAVDGQVDAETRLEMARLGCLAHARVEASDLELRRSGKSYTVDTLDELRAAQPDAALYLIVGSDMLHDLPRWYRPERILQLAHIAYVPRIGQETDDDAGAERLRKEFHARVTALPAGADALSSTMIRERLERGLPVDGMLPARVLMYCHETGLYFPGALRETMARVRRAISGKRFLHSAGCAVAAASLAERWGADPERARLAAYLHDCAKGLDPRALCALSGDDTDVAPVQHAFYGAVLAKTRYGVSDDAVLRAIRRHCTGERDMSLLDKVIYLADAIEPTRDFPGVDELRRSVAAGPDAAMLLALTRSMARIREADAGGMHPATERAVQYFQDILKEEKA